MVVCLLESNKLKLQECKYEYETNSVRWDIEEESQKYVSLKSDPLCSGITFQNIHNLPFIHFPSFQNIH